MIFKNGFFPETGGLNWSLNWFTFNFITNAKRMNSSHNTPKLVFVQYRQMQQKEREITNMGLHLNSKITNQLIKC